MVPTVIKVMIFCHFQIVLVPRTLNLICWSHFFILWQQQMPTGTNRCQQVPTGANRYQQVPTGTHSYQQEEIYLFCLYLPILRHFSVISSYNYNMRFSLNWYFGINKMLPTVIKYIIFFCHLSQRPQIRSIGQLLLLSYSGNTRFGLN